MIPLKSNHCNLQPKRNMVETQNFGQVAPITIYQVCPWWFLIFCPWAELRGMDLGTPRGQKSTRTKLIHCYGGHLRKILGSVWAVGYSGRIWGGIILKYQESCISMPPGDPVESYMVFHLLAKVVRNAVLECKKTFLLILRPYIFFNFLLITHS